METGQIRRLFEQYGYVILEEKKSYFVFGAQHSLYPGVDIVLLEQMGAEKLKEIMDEYSRQRFAVRVCKHDELDNLEEFLFDWFFQVRLSNKRIHAKYNEYCNSVLESYGLTSDGSYTYSYVESPYLYEEDVEITETGRKGRLIDSIYNEIKKAGATLIIVEAAAGFGKTSTAMELLKRYEDVDHGVRPLYMELSKDRQASTFRYLLLSQMHREFNVLLGDDIVDINIKNGRIPLIIDGFDELLSEDLDKGSNKSTKKGETMLSTISDYLVNNSKIVLTTRKTAILSGQDYMDWCSDLKEKNNVRIIKYSLDLPQVRDWLPDWKYNKIQPVLHNILNPVLLGYLSFLSEEEFLRICESAELIKNYIEKLLTREQTRQALSFDVDEQKLIFARLASTFAYEDFLSESRDNVKDAISLLSSDLISKHTTKTKDSNTILNTLANHAVLDRKGNNNIGFVNDFVLGVFLAFALLDENHNELQDYYKEMSPVFIDKLLLAMSLANENDRDALWIQLMDHCKNVKGALKLQADLFLLRKSMCDYKNEIFDGFSFSDVQIGNEKSNFENCHFRNTTFLNSSIDINHFKDCVFINCKFYETQIDVTSSNVDFIQCFTGNTLIPMYSPEEIVEEELEKDQKCELLKLYLQVGGKNRKMQLISRIKDMYSDKKQFKKIFGKLVSEGMILTNGDKSHISTKGIDYLNGK